MKNTTTRQLKDYADITAGIPLSKVDIQNSADQQSGLYLMRPSLLAEAALLNETHLAKLDPIVINEEVSKRIKDKHYLQPNDIIITSRSTSYHAAMIKHIPPGMKIVTNNNTICIRPNPSIAYPEAIVVYLRSVWFKTHVIDVEFPKMLTITVGWLKSLAFEMPDKATCKVIAERAEQAQTIQVQMAEVSAQVSLRLEAYLFDQLEKAATHE